jgi:hypothetical protein
LNYYCTCLIPLVGIINKLQICYTRCLQSTYQPLPQYICFYVILKISHDGHNRWPKHVAVNTDYTIFTLLYNSVRVNRY